MVGPNGVELEAFSRREQRETAAEILSEAERSGKGGTRLNRPSIPTVRPRYRSPHPETAGSVGWINRHCD